MKRFEAIKEFFGSGPHGRKVEMSELKALTTDDRKYLAEESAKALGVTLDNE